MSAVYKLNGQLLGATSQMDGQSDGVAVMWSQVSGPGTVVFSDPTILQPTATFPVAGTYVLRLTVTKGGVSFYDDVIATVPQGGIYEGDFVLMMVLDQTGSIGNGGASRGVQIIDSYGSRLKGIGWVSFGDIICQQKGMTSDLASARAELDTYATGAASSPFFCDGGGDTPENGIDGLYYGDQLMRLFSVGSGVKRYIHLVTDTLGFSHNTKSVSSVVAALTGGYYDKVFIENGSASDGSEVGLYRSIFPASPIVTLLDYPYSGG